MNKLLALLLLLPALLKAQIDMLFSEGEDLKLNHHVNVISGNLNLQFEDAIIQGATPFPLIRTYTSGTANQLFLKNSLIQDGWIFLPHVNLILELSSKEHFDKQMRILLSEKNGAVITYAVDKIG